MRGVAQDTNILKISCVPLVERTGIPQFVEKENP